VLGYLVYSALFAAAGCLVSRPEEASQTALPVTLLVAPNDFKGG
jgi:ABC-type Na+ efflux pump permease subunit